MARSFRREEQAAFAREASLEPSSFSLFALSNYDEPRSEGYDEYFDPPLESKYECPICLLGLREPVQTSCGHRFCNGCILRSMRDAGRKCPVDNEPINESQLYPDNFAKREMLSHDVFCRLKKQHGCPWKGPLSKLEDHLSVCEFVELDCPKECGRKLKRTDLTEHLEEECPNRTVPCRYCQNQIQWNGLEEHFQVCPKFPQACEKCGQENIPRDMIEEHLEKECPNTEIKCPFHIVGCTYEGLRTGHLNDMSKKFVSLSTFREAGAQTQRAAPRRTRGDLGARPQEQAAQEVYLSELSTQTHNHQGEMVGLRHRVNNVDNNVHHLERRLEELHMRQERPIQELTMRSNRYEANQLEYEGRVCNGSYIWRIENYRNRRQDAINGVMTAMHGRNRGDLGARPQEQAAQEVYLSELFTQTQNQGGRDELTHGVNNNHNSVHHLVGQVEEILKSMDRRIQELTMRLIRCEGKLLHYEGPVCDGSFIWKVENYRQCRQRAIDGGMTALHSPAFYISLYGYRLCMRIHLNGVGSGVGQHVALFVHMMKGGYDGTLEWPFTGRIALSILDQSDASEFRRHISQTFVARPNLLAFQKPTAPRNYEGYGFVEFAPIEQIREGQYVNNNTMLVRIQIFHES